MKKILVMNIGTELGGIERSLMDFLGFLSNADCEIDLALWKKRGPLFSLIPDGINVIENIGVGGIKDIKQKKGLKKVGAFFKYILFKIAHIFGNEEKVLPRFRKEYDIAISYCQNGYSPYHVIDKVTADKKYLWYHHGAYDKNSKEHKKDLKYYQKYNKVITVSNANKAMLIEKFPTVSIDVIPNLLDERKIRELAEEPIDVFGQYSGLKITTVGRISAEKGQTLSIEVAKQLKILGMEFRWIFVGDGPDKEKCEKLISEYGLQNECLFVGAKANPYPYIKQADLYVQTSFVEADPLTINEAGILKKVIIASSLPPIIEAIQEGNGVFCDLVPTDFAEKIISLAGKTKREEILLSMIGNKSRNEMVENKLKDLLGL